MRCWRLWEVLHGLQINNLLGLEINNLLGLEIDNLHGPQIKVGVEISPGSESGNGCEIIKT